MAGRVERELGVAKRGKLIFQSERPSSEVCPGGAAAAVTWFLLMGRASQ